MNPADPIAPQNSLVDRAKAIILTPKAEWQKIATEPATVQGLFTGYAAILAAISPLASLIGGQVFGYGAFGITYRPPIVSAVGMAIVQYILSLVGLFILALIVNFLAPNFGGQRDKVNAAKVAVYSATAGWLAGIFSLVPALSFLAILGLYSVYLLYTGLPVLMGVPTEKATIYTVAVIVAGFVLGLIASLLLAPLAWMMAPSPYASSETPAGEVTVPGVGTVDLAKLDAASKQMENAAQKMEQAAKTGQSGAAAPTALQALLPASIGNYQRTEVESSGIGAGGSHASGTYSAGGRQIRLEVTDMAALGAIAGMGAAFNVNSNRETATGYERTSTVNGEMVSERWDKDSKDGKFGTTVAKRFMVEASGQADSIDQLKAAVASVGADKLATLAQ